MKMIKGMIGLIPTVVLGGHAIGQIGSNLTGSLAGIGGATQSMVGIGIFGKAASLAKGLFKW